MSLGIRPVALRKRGIMKDGFIRVTALTPKIRVADPEYNAEQIMKEMDAAVKKGARILVFPELCITGYTCQDLFLQETLLEGAKEALRRIAAHTAGTDALMFVGLPLEKEGKLYNAAAVLQDGRVCAFVPKTALPSYAEFYETRHFTPAPESVSFLSFDGKEVPFGQKILFACDCVEGLTVGCEICEDLWAAQTPSTSHCLAGATVIVNLSASNETVGKDSYRRQLVTATSARLVTGYVYASAGDGESTQDLVFGAHNLIAENGVLLAEAKRFENQGVYGDLDIHRLRHERRRMNTFPAPEEAGYLTVPIHMKKEELSLLRSFPRQPFVPAAGGERARRCEEILAIQAHGLKKRLEHTKSGCAVIGISGGLDSTLALLVTVRAFDLLGLPRSDIRCVTMPCFGTTDRTYENACRLTRTLGASLTEVNIQEAVRLHFRDIGHDEAVHDVTYENSQARERTQVLMDIANAHGGLVIGTGDMSELALGWATYNGDHMSMYGVNAGVPKTLVRHLVRYYADTCGNEELSAVLSDVLDTPVSPELLPPVDGKISQKTEDLVGPYELHDFFLYYMLRCGFSPAKIYRIAKETFAGEYGEEEIRKWLKNFCRRFFSQQFKRSCLPDGPKVGSVAVSPRGDLRMPSDACSALWLSQAEAL